MKYHLALAISMIAAPMLSLAEVSDANFRYTHLTGTISQVTVEDEDFEDFHGYEYFLSYSHEFSKGAFLAVSYNRSTLDDTSAYTSGNVDADVTFEAGGNTISVVGGKAFGLGKTVDLYAEVGFGYSSYDLDIDIAVEGDTILSSSESETDTGIAAEVGLRIALDSAQKIELNPSISISSSGGESSKSAGFIIALEVVENVQLGLGASVDLDDDVSQIGGGIRLYF